jgi:hypothetical protein
MADQTRGDRDGSRHLPMTGKNKAVHDKEIKEAKERVRKGKRDEALVRAIEQVYKNSL